MDLVLSIDTPEALTARGVSNTQDWLTRARTTRLTVPAGTTGASMLRALDVPGPDGKPRPLIPGLTLRPYTGGVDVLSYGRLVGALAPAPAPQIPVQRPPADDLTSLAESISDDAPRQDFEVFLPRHARP